MPRKRRLGARLCAALSALCGFACLAAGQGMPYCNVTGIDVKRLSNGVQITIQADGLMAVTYSPGDYFNMEALQLGKWDQFTKPVTVLPVRITNARSQVGSVADVGVYPASHVEIAVPPEAQDGVGLDLRIVLYAEAIPISVRVGGGFNIQFWLQDPTKPSVRMQTTPDRRSLIVTVTSDRKEETPAALRKPGADAPKELSVTRQGDLLTINALNADLRDLVREISRTAGKPVVAAQELSHVVSMGLRDVTLEDALDAIAATYGLSVEASGPVIRLAEGNIGSIASLGGSTTDTLRLNYISAFSARDSLPEFMMRYVHVNGDQNALTIHGPTKLVEKLRADLQTLDRPVPQVEVECIAAEFGSSKDLALLSSLDGRLKNSELGMNTATGDMKYVFAGKLPDTFSAQLTALESEGKAVIRARPKTTVLNGRSADFFVGARRLIKIDYLDRFIGQYTSRIIELDLGAKLTVSAWTDGGDTIIVYVKPEISSVAERDPVTGLPTVSTRNATAALYVRNGETILVSGLKMVQDDRSVARSPLFSSLGLLGLPFESPKRSHSETELVFFVTARVVGGRPFVPPSLAAKGGTQAQEKHS